MPDHLDRFLDRLDLEADVTDVQLDRAQIAQLASIRRLIRREGAATVASLDNLTAAIAKLDTDVEQAAADVSTAIQALKDQIAALTAGSISQEQIDALQAGVDTADAAVTALDAATVPPVA